MRRLRLVVGYRGTRYAGWASQPPRQSAGRPTLQSIVQDALAAALGHPVHAQCAGRTDAGVHADGQVISFETTSSMPAAGLAACLGRWLPDDVWLVSADEAEFAFDARRSALRRWYRYVIWRAPERPPSAWQGRCLVLRTPLDVMAMRAASHLLLGRHDVAAFATNPAAGRSTIRTIYAADWLACGEPPSLLLFEVCADAFLKQMVRTLVGSLLWVGSGRWSVDHFGTVLLSADRRQAGPVAPAVGLSLHRIEYPRSTPTHAHHPEDL